VWISVETVKKRSNPREELIEEWGEDVATGEGYRLNRGYGQNLAPYREGAHEEYAKRIAEVPAFRHRTSLLEIFAIPNRGVEPDRFEPRGHCVGHVRPARMSILPVSGKVKEPKIDSKHQKTVVYSDSVGDGRLHGSYPATVFEK
jgi:hypothetical protein